MRHLSRILRAVFAVALISLGTVAAPKPAEASHFRYGHLTWRQTGATRVEFTLTGAFRRGTNDTFGFYPGSASDGRLAVGDVFEEFIGGTVLYPGDRDATGNPRVITGPNGGGLLFICVAIDKEKDYAIGRALDPGTRKDRLPWTYRTPRDPGDSTTTPPIPAGPWRAEIFSCCRIFQLNNSSSSSYRVISLVDLTVNSASAVSALPPIIPGPQSGFSFVIPSVDIDNSVLRYRLATPAESAADQPPGVSVDAVTGVYTVPAGLATGLWTSQVVIEEYDGAGALIGQVAVDFIFNVLTSVTGQPPSFDYPPTPGNAVTLTAIATRPFLFTVQASDPDSPRIRLNTTGAPLGAKLFPGLPVDGSPVSATFSWRPKTDDVGAYSVVFTAEDPSGNFTQTSVNIRVIPPIQVLEPNGTESYLLGDTVTIRWQSFGFVRTAGVKIELSRDGGATFTDVIASNTPDDGQFTWAATGPQTRSARIRISNVADPADDDVSDADFTISSGIRKTICTPQQSVEIPDNEPAFTEFPLPFPDNIIIRGARVYVNVAHPFKGDLEVAVVHPDGTQVMLHDETYEANSTGIDTTYAAETPFTMPAESLSKLYGKHSAGTWKLRVRDLNPGDVGQFVKWCLTVQGPIAGTITVAVPNGGERWDIGSLQTILWSSALVVGNVDVLLSRDGGATWQTIFANTANDGNQQWLVSGPATNDARIRVVSLDDPIQQDTSDASFSILVPFMKVQRPNGGERVSTRRVFNIRWDTVPLTGTVKIELSRDSGATFSTIAAAAPNTGSYAWTPSVGQDTDKARIRVSANSGPPRSDTSDADFFIQTTEIAVTSPNGGEVWYTYTARTITWTSVGVPGAVRIELFRNGTFETLMTSTENDGTETINVTEPPARDARIRITAVDDTQVVDSSNAAFEIRAMKLTVRSPNGREQWGIGTKQVISWTTDGVPGTVDIALSRDGGLTFADLFTNTPNDGSEQWTVTGPSDAGKGAIIRVKASGLPPFDVSDGVFAIVNATIRVLRPNNGEELRVGRKFNLTWSSVGLTGKVNLELSRDGGSVWAPLFTATDNDGVQEWTVTGPDTDEALLRVSSVDLPGVSDVSDDTFQIVTPRITVTSPNGGERLFTGSAHRITWQAQGFDGGVKIEITRNGGSSFSTLFGSTANDGGEDWTVTGPGATNCRIRITAVSDTAVKDESNGPFEITVPAIQVRSPNGGLEWLIGTTQTISWTSVGVTSGVDIDLSRDNGGSFTRLFSNTSNDGAEPWIVTGPSTTSAVIRISWAARPSITDRSDGTFKITEAGLRVTKPTAGDVWRIGNRETIAWEGSVVRVGGGTVDILLSRNGGNSYETIITDTANDGLATWQVTGPKTSRAKVKVVWKPDSSVSGTSDGVFKIRGRRRGRR